jgi:BirA family transcriptional regulator, biotin operon repressor / biotin---[acetyl-CoA-carboxylase] ligase
MFEYNIFENQLKSETFGRHLKYFQSTDSTNTEAKIYLENDDSHGHVIVTKNQTSGRGRRGNEWISTPNKSLTFSIILNQKKIKNKELLPIISAVTIIKSIQKIANVECSIKWPNDIILNNKKLGGILIEQKKNYMIIGIGINVNEDYKDLNIKIKSISTSLRINKTPVIKLESLLACILNKLELYCNNEKIDFINEWTNYCMHINKKIKFYNKNTIQSGIFKGINENGEGIIKINDKIELIYTGMINL